jgi:HD-like signal output (HDOD) protein
MLPAVASEAIQLTGDPECTAGQFSQVVEKDIALAAEILTLANSSVFSSGRSVSRLEQAVVRLGFSQCRNLIIASSTACLMKAMPLQDEWIREVLWQHSHSSATAATALNHALDLGFHGEEFTAGLLHDFGRLLLSVAAQDDFPLVDPLDFAENENVLEHEHAILGTDHCRFGAWFAARSGLPLCLVDAIRWHHEPNPLTSSRTLVAVTTAADHIANYLQREETVEAYDPTTNRGLQQLAKITETNVLEKFAAVELALLTEVRESFA